MADDRMGDDRAADDRGTGVRRVRIDDLRRCLAVAFGRLRLAPQDAEGLGGLLLDSELRGHPDHGVAARPLLAGSTATAG